MRITRTLVHVATGIQLETVHHGQIMLGLQHGQRDIVCLGACWILMKLGNSFNQVAQLKQALQQNAPCCYITDAADTKACACMYELCLT